MTMAKYAEYVVDVSSEKGTPDVITLNDVLEVTAKCLLIHQSLLTQ